MEQGSDTLGVYLSVPFCRAKCSFCNFASRVGTPEVVERYVELLCREIGSLRGAAAGCGLALPESVDTVYLGGGTPSLLLPRQLERVFGVLRGEFRVSAGAEITMEAAPGQIEDALLAKAMELGVRRVSLGVQTFADREAQAVGRSHTEASCRAEFRRLRAAGVRDLGVDLIAGLPLQTERSWEQTLDVALECALDHLSVYMLEIDDESRLGREVLGGGARLHAPAVASDEAVASMYETACERLAEGGFAQYEISNFAREGHQSQHNLKYWLRQPYLGFGLDAHSMAGGNQVHDRVRDPEPARRWANAEELKAYEGVPAVGEADTTTERQAFEETVFLGLRLCEGLSGAALRPFPAGWQREFREGAEALLREGLLRSEGEGWALTRRGQLISSEVFGELLRGVAA